MELLPLRLEQVRDDEDDADRAAVDDALDPRQVRLMAVVRSRDDQADAMLSRHPLDRRDGFGRPGAVDLEAQHLDQRSMVRTGLRRLY